ncbi:MAG: hypothetical protein JST58_17565 [Bacteroidetes bacterium]|nr:hypothetical protein [Bacteroidota bacterium]
MEEKYSESTLLRPSGNRPLDAPLVHIDLPMFIKKIKQESVWKESDRNAITVFKTNGLRLVLIALHKEAVMAKHISEGILSVQVLEGKIQFDTDQQSVELTSGQMLALHERIPHRVLAIADSVFLLTLTATL